MKKEKRITISECDRVIVSSQNDLDGFSCGDDDLDEFFYRMRSFMTNSCLARRIISKRKIQNVL